jgi:cytidylate kinase
VAEYGKTHDNFIFESRLAWYFIPDSFKVCLVCAFDDRVGRVAKREGKDFELAKKETIFREKMIGERYEKYYGIKDFSNEKNFDFVVDTKTNNLEQVVDAIINELKSRKLV